MTAVMTRELLAGSSLVSPELFARLTKRIVSEHNTDQALAERIMSNALAFLRTCADNVGKPLAPSELVDIGWHTFILHTREYAGFCDRIAGRFLHHVPTDEDSASSEPLPKMMQRTVSAIHSCGFSTDHELRFSGAQCSQCHNGCTDDPPPNL